jgi:uncharacterized membrane protein
MAETTTSNPAGSDSGLPSNVAAGLCAIFPLIGGLIFYLIEKKDQFVRHWAVQAILFGAAWFIVLLAISILSGIFGSLPYVGGVLSFLFGVAYLVASLGAVVLWIIGIIKAFQGQRWEYPIISEYGKKWFPNLG